MIGRRVAWVALVALLGCGESRTEGRAEAPVPTVVPVPPAAPVSPAVTAPTEAPVPPRPEAAEADPLLDALAADDGEDDVDPTRPAPPSPVPAAAHGCAFDAADAAPVIPGGGAPALLVVGDDVLVAAYDVSGVRVVRVPPSGPPSPFASLPLEGLGVEGRLARAAPPALARTSSHEVTLAAIDGRGRVVEATFDPALPAAAPIAREVADGGADPRFPPAIQAIGPRRAIAWTDGSATPMRVRLALFEGPRRASTHDVTQAGAGGAAPTFVEGEGGARLYFLDPHVGLSNVHRVALDASGVPGTTEVARPVNLAAEPAALAVCAAAGTTWVAYAAVGQLATRAVGLVEATGTAPPAPLVPGLGYGDPIRPDAAALGEACVFVAEAPTASAPAAPHEVRVRLVDGAGLGPPLAWPAPAGAPAIAALGPRRVALAVRSGEGVSLRVASCAPSR